MKRLSQAVKDYLALRRRLGFELRHETWFLPDFVRFVKASGSSFITAELALRWAQQPANTTSGWWNHRLTSIRQFARYYRAFDPRTEVPPAKPFPSAGGRSMPYIYTPQEVIALMQEADKLRYPLQAATYATLIGLLASTGLRLGEAIALDDDDIDWVRSCLTVRHSKGKWRLVPLHATVLAALKAYAARPDRLACQQNDSFFISMPGAKLWQQNVGQVFKRLRRGAGIAPQRARPPRIHDLRHTFAVSTVLDWYRAGVGVEQRLPWLSTYLGHVSPSSTYWYLTATPELMAAAHKYARRAWKAKT